jgi:uncharacterized OB-fold protein
MAGPRVYSPYDVVMWDSIAQDRMRLQRCAECETFRYPPAACCHACLSKEATWEEISGNGRVLSWTTYHKQYLPAYPVPTTVVAAMLDEGPILITNVDQGDTQNLGLDRPVRVVYGDHPDGYRIPRFAVGDESDA